MVSEDRANSPPEKDANDGDAKDAVSGAGDKDSTRGGRAASDEVFSGLNSLLEGLSSEAIDAVYQQAQSHSFEAGETITSAGEVAERIYVVIAGRARIWADDSHARTLMTVGPGEQIGASSVLAGHPYQQTVTALSYVETLSLTKSDLSALSEQYPQINERLCWTLSNRLMQVSTAQNRKRARGFHSLAIISSAASAPTLAQALSERIATEHERLRPIYLRANESSSINGRYAWCGLEEIDNARSVIAQSSAAGESCIAVADNPETASLAMKECDQALVILDAETPESWIEDLYRDHADNRIVVAVVRKRVLNSKLESSNVKRLDAIDPDHCVVVTVDSTGSKARESWRVDSNSVERIHRRLRGRRIGLALGGGGARGIAHIGVLRSLAERGMVFDAVSGTSAGAIVGAAYTSGVTLDELTEMFRRDFTPPRLLVKSSLGRRLFLLQSFRGSRIETILRNALGEIRFEDLDIPLSTICVDLIRGERIIHDSGDVVDAVLASINHPVFGRPILRGDQALVDGGILMNVPASVLSQAGCDFVVSVDVGAELSPSFARDGNQKTKAPSYIATISRTIDVAQYHSTDMHRQPSGVIIKPKTAEFKLEDFHEVDALVGRGKEAADAVAEDVVQQVQEVLTQQ